VIISDFGIRIADFLLEAGQVGFQISDLIYPASLKLRRTGELRILIYECILEYRRFELLVFGIYRLLIFMGARTLQEKGKYWQCTQEIFH
jgi:hypothetical protein